MAGGAEPGGAADEGDAPGTPPRRCLLLAGSHGVERAPFRPDPRLERWFEPLHVRDAAGARARISAQILAGADVVVAPTWLTHRRALLAVGETRQARAWTAAAIAVGRDAIEEGLERREQARASEEARVGEEARAGEEACAGEETRAGEEARADELRGAEDLAGASGSGDAADPGGRGGQPGAPRPLPRLAGTLPAPDDGPELDSGHLLPREAATARDYIDQAGLLADAEPDLLLVEGQRSVAEVRLAAEAATATGLPVWLALSGLDPDALTIEALVDLTQELTMAMRVERVLLPPSTPPVLPEVPSHCGGLVRSAAEVAAWLERGTDVIGLLDGATPSRLRPIRAAIDTVELADLERRRDAEVRWWSHVRLAAAMAPGGRALWLGPPPAGLDTDHRLPEGFDWLMLDRSDVPGLPEGHFRFVVDPLGGPGSAARAERLLDEGGIAALRGPVSQPESAQLRLVAVDESTGPPLAILRRDR